MKLPKMKTGDLLVIKLQDLTHVGHWISDEDAYEFKAATCAATGWFLSKDKEVIRIFNLVNSDGEKTVTAIPIGSIRSVKVIPYNKGE